MDRDAKRNGAAWESAAEKYVREYEDHLRRARYQTSLAACELEILRPGHGGEGFPIRSPSWPSGTGRILARRSVRHRHSRIATRSPAGSDADGAAAAAHLSCRDIEPPTLGEH